MLLLRKLQQYLPFTVLKPITFRLKEPITIAVAAVLTAFGIETSLHIVILLISFYVATVLTVYGIETILTTYNDHPIFRLQQYLPLAVLKPFWFCDKDRCSNFVATVLM